MKDTEGYPYRRIPHFLTGRKMHLNIKFVRVMPPAPPQLHKDRHEYEAILPFFIWLHFGKNAEGSTWMANSGETQTQVEALRWATLQNKKIPPFLMAVSIMQTVKQAVAAAKGKLASITLLIINTNSFKHIDNSSVTFHNINAGSSSILIRTQRCGQI